MKDNQESVAALDSFFYILHLLTLSQEDILHSSQLDPIKIFDFSEQILFLLYSTYFLVESFHFWGKESLVNSRIRATGFGIIKWAVSTYCIWTQSAFSYRLNEVFQCTNGWLFLFQSVF